MRIWDACRVGGERERQKPDDGIYVFLNYKLVGKFKTREDSKLTIKKLLSEAPTDLSEFESYLLW